MKLHLGCGQIYLQGYVNIDFPLSKHSVQQKSVADVTVDIQELKYPSQSVEEIRLRHVFEHFPRPVALALLASWRSWLKYGGILRIEVPDFDRTALEVLKVLNNKKKRYIALRHIFGSQEADWAVHYEGWSPKRLQEILNLLGFTTISITKNQWKGTYNFEIITQKNNLHFDKRNIVETVRTILTYYLIDETNTEKLLLREWMNRFKKQLNNSWVVEKHL